MSKVKDRTERSSTIQDETVKGEAEKWSTVEDGVQKPRAIQDGMEKPSTIQDETVKGEAEKWSTVEDEFQKSSTIQDGMERPRAIQGRMGKMATVEVGMEKLSTIQDETVKGEAEKRSTVEDGMEKPVKDQPKRKTDESITSRTYKDGVFTTLFHDKAKICELYNALKNTDQYKESDIELQTLEKALYKLHRDDLAFSVDNKLVILIEHQSTPSPNLPIRMLLYMGRVLERMLDMRPVYSNLLVTIPCPEFYVMYNGEDPWPEELTLKLSDAYPIKNGNREVHLIKNGKHEAYPIKSGENFLELSVKVLNINPEKHNPILSKSGTLNEYSQFIERIRKHIHGGCTRDEAIEKAIRECIEEDILRDFLSKHGGEIYNMIFEEFNMETAIKVAKEDGMTAGIEKGMTAGKIEGMRATFELLEELGLPEPVIKEKLYEKYSDISDVVDQLFLHEDLEEYKAKE